MIVWHIINDFYFSLSVSLSESLSTEIDNKIIIIPIAVFVWCFSNFNTELELQFFLCLFFLFFFSLPKKNQNKIGMMINLYTQLERQILDEDFKKMLSKDIGVAFGNEHMQNILLQQQQKQHEKIYNVCKFYKQKQKKDNKIAERRFFIWSLNVYNVLWWVWLTADVSK